MPYSSRTCRIEVLEVAARLRVDRRERLVHQQDRRLVRERTRDRDALLHAAGELPRVVVDEAGQADGVERLLDEPLAVGARDFLWRSGSSTLFRTEAQGISERPYSWKTSAISSGGSVTGLPRSRTSPRVGLHQPRDALQQRRLAAAGRADDAGELALLDGERDVADRVRGLLAVAVRLAEVP